MNLVVHMDQIMSTSVDKNCKVPEMRKMSLESIEVQKSRNT